MKIASPVCFIAAALCLSIATAAVTHQRTAIADGTQANGVTRVPLVISEGHDTVPVDRGRPVILIANALGVPPEVFREAFSHVHPAPAGERPSDEQVRENKRALLDALGKYGITNERLDEVSNYYRYNRSRGEMWPTTEAEAYALVKNGKITGFEVSGPGSGYSSTPTLSTPDGKSVNAEVQLSFSQTMEENGGIGSIKLTPIQ